MLGRGTSKASPTQALIVSILVAVFGSVLIWWGLTAGTADSADDREMSTRSAFPKTRLGQIFTGISCVMMGLALSNGYRQWTKRFVLLWGAAIVFMLIGCSLDSFRNWRCRFRCWRRRGCPVMTRCPQCGRILDFQIDNHQCPDMKSKGFEVIQRRNDRE